ncbi:MAG: glycosyltransferase [Flavobacteriaceae bacterium]|nr:glycosyltransferase [Flavobacteriaceae bacterium]
MIKPLVSIIIPTYNRAHLIGETLDSGTNLPKLGMYYRGRQQHG